MIDDFVRYSDGTVCCNLFCEWRDYMHRIDCFWLWVRTPSRVHGVHRHAAVHPCKMLQCLLACLTLRVRTPSRVDGVHRHVAVHPCKKLRCLLACLTLLCILVYGCKVPLHCQASLQDVAVPPSLPDAAGENTFSSWWCSSACSRASLQEVAVPPSLHDAALHPCLWLQGPITLPGIAAWCCSAA